MAMFNDESSERAVFGSAVNARGENLSRLAYPGLNQLGFSFRIGSAGLGHCILSEL